MMQQPPQDSSSEQHTAYWLQQLRAGDPAQQAEARSQLAAGFEARAMPARAVELLVANAQAGFRSPEMFETLARLYRQIGNEFLAVSAAMEANRLREQGTPPSPSGFQPGVPAVLPWQSASPAPHTAPGTPPPPPQSPPPSVPPPGFSGQAAGVRRWQHGYDASARARPRRYATSGTLSAPGTPPPGRWHRPLRMVGWVVVALIAAAALAVGSMNPPSGIAYAAAAAALALMLAGLPGLRRSLRVPSGPLGDGGLIFLTVLLFLAGGAMLPRVAGTPPVVSPAVSTPGPLYRGTATPAPPAAAGPITPGPSPAAASAAAGSPPGPASPQQEGDAEASGDLTGQRFIVIGDPAGATLRASPSSTRRGVLVGDGDVVVAIAADRSEGGWSWRQVSVPGGERGWIRIDRLKPAPAAPPLTIAGGLPPNGRSCTAGGSIKGHINSAGEQVYLKPGSEWYYLTIPEICFRSEADAVAAGFQPSPR